MKWKYPIVSPHPPVIHTALDGKRYAVGGGQWEELPDYVTNETLHKWMVWGAAVPKKNVPNDKVWEVKGSKGNTYTVSRKSGAWACTCAGFKWRRDCKHMEAKQQECQNEGGK